MPNIIEQQDLLKGLPDNRLALLMQNPVADIPPFLVAAEAQRRQAIRQQFSGDAGKESVVDTLTKQLANVPQNVQAPMQAPPQMPPPQQMAPQGGIGAIQPQQMSGGGAVQRYQGGGTIEPMWRVPDLSYALPGIGSWIGEKAKSAYDWATTPYSERTSEPTPTVPDLTADITMPNRPLPGRRPEFEITGEPATYTDMTPSKPKVQPDPTKGTADSSNENKSKAELAAYRKRIEDLYGAEEPSNWEEAQKWFAMAAQIMNPDANLAQSLANAGSVYAQAEAEQSRAKREEKRALQEALLKYDIGERDYNRELAAAAQEKKLKAIEYQSERAYKQAELYRKAADDAQADLNRQMTLLSQSGPMITPDQIAKDPTIIELKNRVIEANKKMNDALIVYQGYNNTLGGAYGLPTGFETSDGDSITTVGG